MRKIGKNWTKKAFVFLLAWMMVLTGLPMEGLVAYAAPENIKINVFDFVQTNDKGNTTVRITIQGGPFIQEIGTNREKVVTDILVKGGVEYKSLMQGDAIPAGVKHTITDSLITIEAPKTGDFMNLNMNLNGTTNIIVNTKGLPKNSYTFDVKVNDIPSMPGNLESKKIYVGQELKIEGLNFTGVLDTKIAGASHEPPTDMVVAAPGNLITIPKLKKGNLNKSEKIQFIKKDTASNVGVATNEQPKISFTSEYLDRVIVFEKLLGMDNLRVLPSEGPNTRPSKITVQAMEDDKVTVKENVFKKTSKVYIRRTIDNLGNEEELALTNVKLVRKDPNNDSSPVIGIEGYTPAGVRPVNSVWDVIIKEDGVPSSEGIAPKAFTFVAGDNAPRIEGLDPSEGPNTGGTTVLIKGRNLFNVRTPGLTIPNGVKVVPSGPATKDGNQTLVVKYTVPAGVEFGNQAVTEITRKIRVRIASMTNAKDGKIHELPAVPKPGDVLPTGEAYPTFHYMTDGGDGVLVTTTNSGTEGPQEVLMDIETIIKAGGSEIRMPEGALYKPFTYNEKNPTPKVEDVQLEFGYPNDAEEEQDPTGTVDGVKPLMIRIKGQKFEAYKDTAGEMHYPTVQFTLPDNTVLPIKSSADKGDTRVLNSQGNPIDGIYNKTGEILVISVVPTDKAGMRRLLMAQNEEAGGYKEIKGIIQVTNPSGNSSSSNVDATKFTFRRPKENSPTDTHSMQPTITAVTMNGSPAAKLPSDRDSEIEIKVKATAGISDLKKTKIAVDGVDISSGILKSNLQGAEAVFNVKVPKGFIGKTRLQVIIPEGLMDSYWLTFDNVRGPEILAPLIPSSGDKGTYVVIKRNTQANTVSFKVPLPTSANEEERIGSRVLWNGEDISKLYNGYQLDASGKVVYQLVDDFKNFKQPDKTVPAGSVTIPSKYVYVVDADTIYLKVPTALALKEATYKLQIKNPDGSESSVAVPFEVVNTIEKTKIDTIIPNSDDSKGGIVVTIKAGKDSSGRQTNFKGDVDVYFGSKKAEVVGYDIDYREVYVKVPPLVDFKFPDALEEKVEAYTVPVMVQNKVNKSTDTKPDGFVYLNPAYAVKITQVYNQKYATEPENPDANKGIEGDIVVIRGQNFRLETDTVTGNYILPKVMFGYATAETPVEFGAKNMKPDGTPETDAQGRAELEWIKVKVPKKPFNAAADGSVSVLVQNPDGAKDIKEKAFFYKQNKPEINQKSSILKASRFTDHITVVARDITEKGLTVAFGEDKNFKYEKEFSASAMEIETKNQLERIVVKYNPVSAENIEIYYKKGANLILMEDTLNTNKGKATLAKIGDKITVGLNWKNTAYHSTDITKNPDLLAKLNVEYMDIYIQNKAPSINMMVVRRALGKVTGFVADAESKISIDTPYYEKMEKTIITLLNSDGTSAEAPFEFHGGMSQPIIQDVSGSKEDPQSTGTPKGKLKTHDVTVEGELEIIGENFKDVDYIRIGNKNVEILNITPDYKIARVKIPKGDDALVGKRLPISIVTKEGNASSDKPINSNPVIYFMYIKPGSKPVIETVTPQVGPRTGGTYVRIVGKGFRETDEFGIKDRITVNVNGAPAAVRNTEANDKGDIVAINITTPPSRVGKGMLQVVNADQGTSEPKDFTYISQPKITKIGDSVFFNDTESVVKINGEDFQTGAKVIIGGTLQKGGKKPADAKHTGMLGVVGGINQDAFVTGGQEAADVKVESSTALSFKMPKDIEKLDSLSIIILNPDGGISDPGEGAVKPPVPDAPKITATPGYEKTMLLRWKYDADKLNKPDKFEIYARKRSGDDYVFVGDVSADKNEYVVKGLDYDTRYDFKVRALNKYGAATDVGEVSAWTLRQSEDYKEKQKAAEADKIVSTIETTGKKEIVGTTLNYTVGSAEYYVDLSRELQRDKTVNIPVSALRTSGKSLTLIDKGMTLTLPYSSLYTQQVRYASDNGYLRLKLSSSSKELEESVKNITPRNMNMNSRLYYLGAELVDGKQVSPITTFQSPITLTITPDRGRLGYGATIYRYNEAVHGLTPAGGQWTALTTGGYYVLLSQK